MGLFDFFSAEPAQKAAAAQEQSLKDAQTAGSGLLTKGLDLATGSYTSGISPFLQNFQTATAGQNAYADAFGINGPQGNARAVANFQGSPGYQYAVDQATQAVNRNQASTGQLASGATNSDVLKQVLGLANQNWGQYTSGLLPFLQGANQAAGGIQQGYTGLAGTQAANLGQQASMAYGTDVGIGNAQAQAAMAPYQASKNLFDFGLNAAKAVASFIPKPGGGG